MAIYTFTRKLNARKANELYLNNVLDTTLLPRSVLHLRLSVSEKVCQQEDLFVSTTGDCQGQNAGLSYTN